MQHAVYFAHAPGEESEIEKLATPIREAGYNVQHRGTVVVGDSVLDEASKILSTGCAVVLCGTIKAIGTPWARRIVNAARSYSGVRIFAVQFDREADIQTLALDSRVAEYWRDPGLATTELLAALKEYYPLSASETTLTVDAERRYRELALLACDIIDLANLPEDRHVATRQLELRRLYVPLRIRVEAAAQSDTGDDQLEAIERRREARRRSSTPWTQEDNIGRVSIGDRLAKAKRLVVLGDPGAGKSTIIRWLATAYLLRLKNDPDWKDLPDVATLPAEDWLPILIRCRDLDDSCVSLDDILRQMLRKAEITEAESAALRAILSSKIQKGKGLLLIDGLDEINDPISRANFCQQIERIAIANPDAAIVVSSRIVGYREMGYRIGRGFEHVSVDDLSPEDKDDFARRWCALTEPKDRAQAAADDLIKDIHSTSRIERFTGNPMLLTTMALVKRKVGKLPRRRIDLYWEAVQALLAWRSAVDLPIDDREALPQLEYVAYAMCHQGAQQLREDEIIGLFERMRDEYPRIHAVKAHTPEEFLTLLERRTGILVQAGQVRHKGRGVPVYEFRHLTFQEYLAALALVDGRFPDRDTGRTLAENVAPLASRTETTRDANGASTMVVSEAWREALRLCVACCKDDEVDGVMRAILDPLPGEQGTPAVRSRAILAALCLADEPNISEPLAAEVLRCLLEQFQPELSSNDDDDVTNAVKELVTSRWAGTTSAACLQHYGAFVVKNDLRAWKLFASYGLALEPHLPNDAPSLKLLVQECLAQLNSGESSKIIDAASKIFVLLIARDTSTVSPYITKLDLPTTLFALLRREPMIALAAFLALAACNESNPKIWTPSEVQLQELFGFLERYKGDDILLILTAFLIGMVHYLPAIPALLGLLKHSSPSVRAAVAEALGDMGDALAAEPLMATLADEDVKVRQAALLALGKLKTEAPVHMTDAAKAEPLVAFFRNADVDTRRAAAQALGRIRYTGAVDPLAERLQDQNESSSVRAAAAEALGSIGDVRAIEPLLVGLRSQDWSLSSSAANALGKIGLPAIAPLIATLNDDYMLVTHIADALANIGDPAIEALIQTVESDSGPRVAGAMTALGRMKSQRSIPYLIAKLESPDDAARWQAAYALGNIGGPEAIAALRARARAGEYAINYSLILANLPNLNDIDRVLLSSEMDGRSAISSASPVTEARIQEVATKLGLTADAVRHRYNELSSEYFLLLEWDSSAASASQGSAGP